MSDERDLAQELDVLRSRMTDLEDQLTARGLEILHGLVLGQPIMKAKWSAAAGQWSATFCYRCECGRIHGHTLIVPAEKPDGSFYDIPAECGQSTVIQLWKNPVNRLQASLTKIDTAADRFNSYPGR